jgi:fumarate reductase flavoprotein subunit
MPVRIEMAASFEGMGGYPSSVMNVFSQPNLLVNRSGVRIINEENMQNVTFLSNAAYHQKDRILFSVLDDSIAELYLKNGVDVINMVRPDTSAEEFRDGMKMASDKKSKTVIAADSIEKLADLAGIDGSRLEKTVKEYNQYCISGDSEFYKDRRYLRPLIKGPYYAAAVRPGGYGTVGGIRINDNCEVLDDSFSEIPGLYAAGADACNIYDDSYMFLLPGNSMGFALNTGRIAADNAVSYIERNK